MLRFAICDDDTAMTGELDNLLMELSREYSLEFDISVFFSGEDFCKQLEKTDEKFDIVLMDIEMRNITGIEVGKMLRKDVANDLTLLIFISSHQRYYRDIVDLNIFCFIPKPIYTDEFNHKLNKAINWVIRQKQISKQLEFTIRKNKKEINVLINTIMYLESNIRMIRLYTKDGIHEYYGVLDIEENKLPKDTFIRIHKSFLINFKYIDIFASKHVKMIDGNSFPISEKYRDKVISAYMRYRGI